MRYPGPLPLVGDKNRQLAAFPAVPDHERCRGNLNFHALLFGDSDEAATFCRIRIANPDQIITGELGIPTPEAKISCADREPVKIGCHAIHVMLSDRPYADQLPGLRGPAMVDIDRFRHCGSMHIFARRMDLSAKFYKLCRRSNKAFGPEVVVQ
jgi:hypothetical protein